MPDNVGWQARARCYMPSNTAHSSSLAGGEGHLPPARNNGAARRGLQHKQFAGTEGGHDSELNQAALELPMDWPRNDPPAVRRHRTALGAS